MSYVSRHRTLYRAVVRYTWRMPTRRGYTFRLFTLENPRAAWPRPGSRIDCTTDQRRDVRRLDHAVTRHSTFEHTGSCTIRHQNDVAGSSAGIFPQASSSSPLFATTSAHILPNRHVKRRAHPSLSIMAGIRHSHVEGSVCVHIDTSAGRLARQPCWYLTR